MYLRAMVHTCPQCATVARSWEDFCPQCSARISNPSRVRALGWMLIVIGAGLTAAMAYLIVLIARLIEGSDDPGATSSFTGTQAQAAMVFGLLGLVLAFGLVALAGGAWQARYGTRNPRLVKVVLAFGAVFLAIGTAVQYLG
jgi:magnesium-transporting ATPase (P-type)